jgi:hypothetical protein
MSRLTKIEAGMNLEKEKLLQEFIDLKSEESPTVYLAQKIFELYSNPPSQEAFNDFLKILNNHKNKINDTDIKQYYTYLRTYCNNLIVSGRSDLYPVLHEIHKDNLESGYYYHLKDRLINCGSFFNIVNTALKVNNFEWSLEFIESHKNRIVGDNENQDYYRLIKANFLFYQKKYDNALDFIPSASNNLDFHLLARRLEIMIYYETKSDLLTYKIDAFKMYLSRSNKKILSEDNYELNSNFVNTVYQLNQASPGDSQKKALILQKIDEKKQIIAKDWLVEKAQELK